MDTFKYINDGTEIEITRTHSNKPKRVLPVETLELFMDTYGINHYDYERLTDFHRLGRKNLVKGVPTEPKLYCVDDLAGIDLTGTYIEYYVSNWEDSETIGTASIVGVEIANPEDPLHEQSYKFKFIPEYEEYRRKTDEYYDSWDEETQTYTLGEPYEKAVEVFSDAERFENIYLNAGSSLTVIFPEGTDEPKSTHWKYRNK